MLHVLLDLADEKSILAHPKVGFSWEWFAMEAVTRQVGTRPEHCFFWATHAGAELDLVIVRGQSRWGAALPPRPLYLPNNNFTAPQLIVAVAVPGHPWSAPPISSPQGLTSMRQGESPVNV